jgi:hypothetical protein
VADLLGTWRPAAAQEFPVRPLRWKVGFALGGGATIVGRVIAWTSGQPVLVEK